jgi:hypothetical protein
MVICFLLDGAQALTLPFEAAGFFTLVEIFTFYCLIVQMCILLKRKHTEAKELSVRAIVNNNMLLMLNHPMFEEKISFLLLTNSHVTTVYIHKHGC